MEGMDAQLCKQFQDKLTMVAQLGRVPTVQQRIVDLNTKFTDQATRLDQVQAKVDLSMMASLGHVQQEQLHVMHAASREGHPDHHGPQLVGPRHQFRRLPPTKFHTTQVNFPTSTHATNLGGFYVWVL